MIKNMRLLDGYALNVADGYGFTTRWVDLVACVQLGVSVVFVGGAPTGTLTVQTSNDPPDNVNGFVPMSAWDPTNPTVLTNPALDGLTYPGSSTAVAAAGIYKVDCQNICERFFRVVYVSSGNSVTAVTIMYNAKSNNA